MNVSIRNHELASAAKQEGAMAGSAFKTATRVVLNDERLMDLELLFTEAQAQFEQAVEDHSKIEQACIAQRPEKPRDVEMPPALLDAYRNLRLCQIGDKSNPVVKAFSEHHENNRLRVTAWRKQCRRMKVAIGVDKTDRKMRAAMNKCGRIAEEIYSTDAATIEGCLIKIRTWNAWDEGDGSSATDLLESLQQDLGRLSAA